MMKLKKLDKDFSNPNLLTHINILRVIAIFLVVLGHATRNMEAPNLHLFYPEYTPFLEVFVKKYIYSFHMPLFFWISGYIFFYSMNQKDYKFFVRDELYKKIKRLIVPLYATSFLVLLPTMILFGNLSVPIWKQMIFMLQMSSNDHLWFLKVLFLIFLLVIPIMPYLNKTKDSILITITLFLILVHISIKFPIHEINIVFKYLPYFMFGYITSKLRKELDLKTSLFIGVSVFIIHFFMFYVFNYYNIYNRYEEFWVYLIAILGIYSYYYFSIVLSKIKLLSSVWERLRTVDENSYSIYLFHVTFLYIVLYINSYFNIENNWYRVIAVFILGMLIPIYMQKILSYTHTTSFLFSIKSDKNFGKI